MNAATFSADGSVLAVAAETVITLWDPEQNILIAVIGETLTVHGFFTYLPIFPFKIESTGKFALV